MITAVNLVKQYLISQMDEQYWREAFEANIINDNIYMNGPQTNEEIEEVFEALEAFEDYMGDIKYEFVTDAGEPTGRYWEDFFCIQERAKEMFDGSFVRWENQMGGGKHSEPNSEWMDTIEYIKVTKEMKMVNVYE